MTGLVPVIPIWKCHAGGIEIAGSSPAMTAETHLGLLAGFLQILRFNATSFLTAARSDCARMAGNIS
jgi:hypothetical protein